MNVMEALGIFVDKNARNLYNQMFNDSIAIKTNSQLTNIVNNHRGTAYEKSNTYYLPQSLLNMLKTVIC